MQAPADVVSGYRLTYPQPADGSRITRHRQETADPDFANLVGCVQKGGKLTRAERAMLKSMATGTGPAPLQTGFAKAPEIAGK